MARRETAIPSLNCSDQSSWLDEQLMLVCRNLLQRPSDCRGPFVIPDRELRAADDARPPKRLRLAAAPKSNQAIVV
jgi:hypothetical protein